MMNYKRKKEKKKANLGLLHAKHVKSITLNNEIFIKRRIMTLMMDGNLMYCDKHFLMWTNMSCCISETNIYYTLN